MSSPANEPSSREQRLQSVLVSILEASERGQVPEPKDLLARHPEFAVELLEFLANRAQIDRLAHPLRQLAEAAQVEAAARRTVAGTAAPEPGIGTKVRYFGDYELLAEIARGGMGVVFKARQVSLNRTVALKMILAGQLASAADVQRFHSEAEAAANLDHPNIVPIYEVGKHEGQHYFSMKFVDGHSLAQEVPQLVNDPKAAARLLATIARAVHHAHQRGILHRDLKPGNVLVDAKGEPHVTDFGLAKRVEGEQGQTRTGAVVGTPSYMPPEQAAGRKALTTAADTYSLGAVLYELLTGKPPFRGETSFETLIQVMEREPEPPRSRNPRLDRDLETICLKCLEKEPKRRYGSAEALAEDLGRFLGNEPIEARPTGVGGRLAKWTKRRPAIAALSLALLLALLGLLGLAVWSYIGISRALDDVDAQRLAALAAGKREVQQRHEAEKARDAAVAETYRALLSETRALRLAHPPGWRSEALQKLHRLKGLETPRDLAELRSEAIACISEFDVFAVAHPPGGEVWSLDFSPDGTMLASASYDGTVRLWDVAKGRATGAIVDPDLDPAKRHQMQAPLPAVRFRPGGDWLAFTTWGRGIGFEPWKKNQALFPTLPVKDPARYLAFDGAGRLLAVTWKDGRVGVYDAGSGAVVREIQTKSGPYFHLPVALSPDGKLLAAMGPEHTVQLYSVADEKPPVSLGQHRDVVRALCFNRAGDRLASASADHTVKLWNLRQPGEPLILVGHTARVNGVTFHPDGSLLATGSDDRTVRLWDARTGETLRVIPTTANALSVAFSPEGSRLAAADALTIYQLTSRQGRQQLAGHAYGVGGSVFHPSKPMLASGAWDRQLIFWDLQTGQPVRRVRGERKNPIEAIAAAPDGTLLATGLGSYTNASGTDFSIDLWDWETGTVQRQLKGAQSNITALAFNPSSKLLASGTGDGNWFVWDVATAEILHRGKTSKGTVRGISFASNGGQLVIGESEGRIVVHDLAGGKSVRAASVGGGLSSLAVAPGGRHLAVGGVDGTLSVLALPDLEARATLSAGSGPILAVAYSPDGALLAASSADRKVTLWDARSHQRFFTLPQNSPVHHLTFDPSGQRLAISGAAELITVWDLSLIRPELGTIGLDW